MNNPFEYRSIALGRRFIDRKKELATLMECMRSGQNVTMYSPRRYGKSTLILECFRRLRKECITVYLDFNRVNSVADLAENVVEETAKAAYTKIELLAKDMKEMFKSLRPTVDLTSDGISITLKAFDVERDMKEAIGYPQRVAEKKKKRVVFAMDEFQRIAFLDGDVLERMLRSEIQLQDRVSYVFSGSKVSMLKEMFEKGDRPFFQSTKILTIDRIDETEFMDYIEAGFRETNVEISDDVIKGIVASCEGHPQRTKQLCFEVWNSIFMGASIGSIEELNRLVATILKNDEYINELWDSIRSPLHRRLLIGIAKEGSEQHFSIEFLKKHDLGSPSHVQRAITSLEANGILHEAKITDPFLRLWILQNAA